MTSDRTRIEGRVVDREGQPVADASVAVPWGTAATPEIGYLTDDKGRFRMGLPAGSFRLYARDDHHEGSVEINVVSEAGMQVDIVLDRDVRPAT